MAKIEVLFPEVCNMFGNMYNIKYLEQLSNEIEVINTSFIEKPKFLKEEISMVYMAPMTEKSQEIVIKKLLPYVDQIKEKINQGQLFLIIGNALEVFGKYIENEDRSKVDGLGITELYAKRDMMHRYNSPFLGKFEDMKIVGFKSQFAMSYGDNKENSLFEVEKGIGINKESKLEGLKINNFIATYVLGPILIFNPEFTKYILKLMNVQIDKLLFEDEIKESYDIRMKEFERLNF